MTSKSLSTFDQINELLQPCPELGPDSDVDSDTNAKIADYEFEDGVDVEQRRSNLSQVNEFSENPRYTGVKVARQNSDGAGFRVFSIKEVSSNASDVNDDESSVDSDAPSGSGSGSGSDSDSDSDGDGFNRNLSQTENNVPTAVFGEELPTSIQHIGSSNNLLSEVEKANDVKNQLCLWDRLLEFRIRLQKSMALANRCPKYNTIGEFKLRGGPSFSSELEKAEHKFVNLLDKLVTMQKILISSYSETKDIGEMLAVNDKNKNVSKGENKYGANNHSSNCQYQEGTLGNFEGYECELALLHNQYVEFRNATIQKWNDRTKVSSGRARQGDFSSFEQTTLQQIQHLLSHRARLVQRSRLRGAGGAALGDHQGDEPQHDPEVFDDSDFYHQMLKEVIERHGDASHDAAAAGRRWAAMQKLRCKMKRRVDTRATKGRRLRHDPYEKLVGLMAPATPSSHWDERATTELFHSLFGQKK